MQIAFQMRQCMSLYFNTLHLKYLVYICINCSYALCLEMVDYYMLKTDLKLTPGTNFFSIFFWGGEDASCSFLGVGNPFSDFGIGDFI